MITNIQKIQSWLETKRLSGYWVTKPENVRWLTGYEGHFGIVLIQKKGRNLLITDSRYSTFAKKLSKGKDFDFFCYDQNFKENIKKEFSGSVYAIEDSLTIAQLKNIEKSFPQIKWRSLSQKIEGFRRSKSKDELQKIATAQSNVDDIFRNFFQKHLKVGVTEKEIEYKLKHAIEAEGKFGHAFEYVIAFGENSACPHYHAQNRKLRLNENVLIDCGATYDGYCSDMTRNFWFGGKVDPEFQSKYDLLLHAQVESMKEIKVGVKVKNIDKICRELLGEEEKSFTHSYGHGVGLEIHEAPNLSGRSKEILLENEVVTSEPGLYYEGKFGIRIEDLVIVKKDGCEVLSNTPKELIIIKS